MDINSVRIFPHNIEAEQSVIGAMIIDKNAIADASEALTRDDFYQDKHQVLFASILDLFAKDVPVDIITLIEYLRANDRIDKAGGITYITELSNSIASTANLSSYIKIVNDKSTLRRLIRASTEIIEDSYNNQDKVESVIEGAEKKIFDLAQKRDVSDYEPINSILERKIVEIEKVYLNKGGPTGIASGFPELDDKTSGFQEGDMVLIAARPSMGKTTFALNIAQYAAMSEGKSIVIFSLEMSKEQLAKKLLAAVTNIEMQNLTNGELDDSDWQKIARASGPLGSSKMYIDDSAGITITEMRSKCRRIKIEYGIDLIMIDYLQLMSGSGENRQQEVSAISRAIKALAKEMRCPVIALSQLSRAPEQRADHRPMLSDLRESGSIEQDADLVMFLYRDDYYNPDTEDKNTAELIIAKQRNGPTGTVKLAWLGQYSKFGRLDNVHQE